MFKNRFQVLTVLFLLVFAPGCSPRNWAEYTYDESNFAMEFPGKPRIKKSTERITNTISMDMTEYTYAPFLGLSRELFTVVVGEVSDSSGQMLEFDNELGRLGARNRVSSMGYSVIEEAPDEIVGYEGWYFEFGSMSDISVVRMFVRDTTMYVMEVRGTREKFEEMAEDRERFFDSFYLLDEY